MTEIPIAAAPVPPHRRRWRRRPRGTSALVTALAAGLALVLAPVAAAAAPASPTATSSRTATSASPSPSPTPSAASEPTLTASPFAGGVVASGGDPVFSVHLRNDTERTVPASEVVVALSRSPLATSDAVTAWLGSAGADGAGGFDEVARSDFPDLAAGDDRTVTVSVPAPAGADADLTPGVYPVTITLAGQIAHTVITVSAADAPSRAVGVIVPVTAGPLTSGLLSSDQLEEATAPQGRLTAVLEGVAGTSAILAVDPAIVASIRVLGSAAPSTARAWLDTLLSLPNDRFALQFGDADLATQVQAGLPAPLQPLTLAPYADAGAFPDTDTDTEPDDETPVPQPGTPDEAAPDEGAADGSAGSGADAGESGPDADEAGSADSLDLATLTDIGATGPAILWPASGSAGGDVVAALDAQVDPGAVLVPTSTVTDPAAGVRGVSGEADLFVYDAAISSALARAAGLEDSTTRGAALAEATAHAQLRGDAPLLTVVDRPDEITRLALRATVTAMTSSPGATTLTLGDLQAAPPAPTTVAEVAASPERVDALTGLLAAETTLSQFATVLVEPDQLTSRERASILQLMGNAWAGDDAAWQSALQAHAEQTSDTLDAVAIVNPGTINFLATSAPISVTVRNELRWPVAVRLEASTGDPRLIVQPSTPVEAGADQNTRIGVPVEARVGSGETSLQLQLWSDAGVAIGPPESIALTVRAEWESVGVTVMIVVVALLVAAGVVRTVLKLRQRRAGGAEDAATTAEGTESA